MINALNTKSLRESIGEETWWGRLVENAVGAHLCNNLQGPEYGIAYWRDGAWEVDFVITKGQEVWHLK